MFNGNNRSLQFAVKGDLSENAALFLSHNFVDGNFGILEPLDEGDLGTIANWLVERVVGHLDVCLRVVDDALNDLVDDRVVKLALHQCVIARVQNEDVLSVEVNDFHFFSRHRTGLAKAEISNEANLLNGVGIANQNVIVLVHVEDAMGERKLHCHGQTLGDGDDQHDEGDDNVGKKLVHENRSTDIFVSRSLNEEDGEGDAKDDEARDETDELQAASNVVEFTSQFSLVLTNVKLGIFDAAGAVLADCDDHSSARASSYVGVGKEEG